MEGEISMNVPKLSEVPSLTVQASAAAVFNQVSLTSMAEVQTKDSVLRLVIKYVGKGDKLKGSAIYKIGF